MRIDFDLRKSEYNRETRGLAFEQVHHFDWEGAVFKKDTRKDYPEPRFIALGEWKGELHCVCFTPIQGGVRVISFRKASRKERKDHHGKETTADR